jgi:hypothetical protein
MQTMDCAPELALADPGPADPPIELAAPASGEQSKSPKAVVFGFAATVTVGLALASWYVGARIVSGDETTPPAPAASVQKPVSAPVAPVPPAVAPAPVVQSSLAQAEWSPVTSVELYLQVAGLGARQDAGFVRSLESKGFHARIASGNADTHILIGPFSTSRQLEKAQRKLQSAGILAIETAQ